MPLHAKGAALADGPHEFSGPHLTRIAGAIRKEGGFYAEGCPDTNTITPRPSRAIFSLDIGSPPLRLVEHDVKMEPIVHLCKRLSDHEFFAVK